MGGLRWWRALLAVAALLARGEAWTPKRPPGQLAAALAPAPLRARTSLAFTSLSAAPQALGTSVLPTIRIIDIGALVFVQLLHRGALREAHRLQTSAFQKLGMGKPYEYKKSILGFAEERTGLMVKLLICTHVFHWAWQGLRSVGLRLHPQLPRLVSSLTIMLWTARSLDVFKTRFLRAFFPAVAESRRRSYVVDRATAVVIWFFAFLVALEMVSTFLQVPVSSMLAFGGVGGLALGLGARDLLQNLLSGLLLLLHEPCAPGDIISFKPGGVEVVGRVERIGWGQTRVRGLDTRAIYIPNALLVQAVVTNMERITHRRFDARLRLRLSDACRIAVCVEAIREGLRRVPKLDPLAMPLRVSFARIGEYFLEVEVTGFFATKSIDEFLALQQAANLEVVRAVHSSGAQLVELAAPPPAPVAGTTAVVNVLGAPT